MKRTELQTYLNEFNKCQDRDVAVIIANPQERLYYKIKNEFVIVDQEEPVLVFEVGEGIPFDEEMMAAVEEDEKRQQS